MSGFVKLAAALAVAACVNVPTAAWDQVAAPSPQAPATTAPAAAVPQQPAPPSPAPAPAQKPSAPPAGTAAQRPPAGVTPPSDYVIGPDDVLTVIFWREKDMSADNLVVRPDGKITLPILNDIQAAGLTPDQLRQKVSEAASRYVEDANATVIVKSINSRKVFVTGQVAKPGPYPLVAPTTVLQMLSIAGGLGDFAKSQRILVMRIEGGQTKSFKFNYKEVAEGRNLQQNIELRPGDTIVVP
jgi:polysaccharide export outer membrane protein